MHLHGVILSDERALIIKWWVPSALTSDMTMRMASGGTEVVTKYLREILKFVGIAACQCRLTLMLEFYSTPGRSWSYMARTCQPVVIRENPSRRSFGNVAVLHVLFSNIQGSSFPLATPAAPVLNCRMDGRAQIKQCRQRQG